MFLNLTESPWIRAGRQYSVRVRLLPLLVSASSLGFTPDTSFPGTCGHTRTTAPPVPAHGIVSLLLKDAGDEPSGIFPPCADWVWCTDQNGTRVGPASSVDCRSGRLQLLASLRACLYNIRDYVHVPAVRLAARTAPDELLQPLCNGFKPVKGRSNFHPIWDFSDMLFEEQIE
ncbi:hypothetical protein C8J57DRAFT_1232442 [Mycena rebaudengoi]|nr:hypothetical protein C8J57DRAFT_1249444 [Mycena rebaudengoi]KAJ7237694.1 hypothetical protein C8J57DRAFT_1246989 [Mycena rebaudengoi]KAJ7261584.1 hypothetical protein C8J57DRAFT_1232442 [Mycena rebaudengoi]